MIADSFTHLMKLTHKDPGRGISIKFRKNKKERDRDSYLGMGDLFKTHDNEGILKHIDIGSDSNLQDIGPTIVLNFKHGTH